MASIVALSYHTCSRAAVEVMTRARRRLRDNPVNKSAITAVKGIIMRRNKSHRS